MKLSHPVSWILTSFACGVVCANDEAQLGSDVIEKVEGAIRDGGAQEIIASMPLDSFTEVHEVLVTLADVPDRPSQRHEQERRNLMKRMSKSHGKWDTNHPRHRLMEALFGFSRYKARQMAELNRWKDLYTHVPKTQKRVLEKTIGYSHKFEITEQLHDVNQKLCDEIVQTALEYYEISQEELSAHSKAKDAANQLADRVSVSQALKHFVRDWSTSGQGEREDGFPCIHTTMKSLFPDRSETDVKVLVPGSGLGRLGHELAGLGGFDVTINEWSMFMNLAYRFVETHPGPGSKSVHPFIDSWSHHATNADMLRGVSFPDIRVNASSVLLVEGDFVAEFKSQKGQFDSVVTYFFIDTARNVMSYFDTIHSVLKLGGYWINFGPLLWGTGPFVQLSLEEIAAVAKEMGFEFLDIDATCGDVTLETDLIRGKEAVYGFNERALTKNAYSSQVWVARKIR
ncbi:Carnosine N-methyltransferase [Colletotrichum siamense]|uniref:Carnosine N-methyltransferase n=1 Tax=Colletotrichum siamense TaxID=690259 RepID=A0A9P5EQR2_COLSI|nr:Carnosine N-methyltransferase [Colletotrichum siamense]KAF4857709.1 Carnosine N-methyltransferase [Colletotrichum siamense]